MNKLSSISETDLAVACANFYLEIYRNRPDIPINSFLKALPTESCKVRFKTLIAQGQRMEATYNALLDTDNELNEEEADNLLKALDLNGRKEN